MSEREKQLYRERMEMNGNQPSRNPNQNNESEPPRISRRRGFFGVPKKFVFGGVIVLILLIGVVLFNQIVGKVVSGTYVTKQAAITGTMTAHMKPGWYPLMFGDDIVWPKSETYFATADKDAKDDVDEDMSIAAQFNEGSKVAISATARIILPTDEQQAIDIVNKYGYRSYTSLRDKHILPILRKAIRNTASLMTAVESYATKRTDFQVWVADQLENGLYVLETDQRKVKADESCIDSEKKKCEMKSEPYKVIKMQADGITPVREAKKSLVPGITILNFEVKSFEYDTKVKEQIAKQQTARMDVQTAIANAKKAEQERIAAEALGKKAVTEAEYKELEIKARQIVVAQREKEVAELAGEKRKNVAKLDRDAAEFKKQEEILLGQGEAERKKLVMMADGALKQKLEAIQAMNKDWANAFATRKVPAYVNYGGSGKNGVAGSTDLESQQFQQLVNLKLMETIGLDMEIQKK